MMSCRLHYIILLLMAVQLAMAQSNVQQYEYWMNNDYGSRSVNTASGVSEISFTIDASLLPSGVNFLNFRMQSETGQWGGLMRHLVYMPEKVDSMGRIAAYEYWMDNDYSSRTRGENLEGSMDIDVSDLSEGVHFFNFCALDGSGRWGALSRHLILIQPKRIDNKERLSQIKWWIDGDTASSQVIEAKDSILVLEVDVSNLESKAHSFNILAQTVSGKWLLPESTEFVLEALPLVPTPKITHEGNTIKIEDADSVDTRNPIEYYYTLDGTKPTRQSVLYKGAFEILNSVH